MRHPKLRAIVAPLRNTPLHPQWLIRTQLVARGLLRDLPGGTVLDVGCGDRWAAAALPAGSVYVGLDYPRLDGVYYGSRPDVFGDAAFLPFADASFDAVLLFEVLEHLPSAPAAIAEIRRVLRPGGVLVFSVPFLYPVHDAPHDYQRYTEYGLCRLLEEAEFRSVEVVPSQGALESAGLTLCLALAGSAMTAMRRGGLSLLALPVLAALVPLANIAAWSLARLLPDWAGLASGYEGRAIRP